MLKLVAGMIIAAGLSAGAASAQEAGADPAIAASANAVTVELNKLEPSDGACRAYLLVENGTGEAFETLTLDIVMFDQEGIVARRLAVETAPMPAGKTSLKVFDVTDLGCEAIGSVLLNRVLACADASGERDDCLDLISVSARTAVPFIN